MKKYPADFNVSHQALKSSLLRVQSPFKRRSRLKLGDGIFKGEFVIPVLQLSFLFFGVVAKAETKPVVLVHCNSNVEIASKVIDVSIDTPPEKSVDIKAKIAKMVSIIPLLSTTPEDLPPTVRRFNSGCENLVKSGLVNDSVVFLLNSKSGEQSFPFLDAILKSSVAEKKSFFNFTPSTPRAPDMNERMSAAESVCQLMGRDNELRYFLSEELDRLASFQCNPNVRGQNSDTMNIPLVIPNGDATESEIPFDKENSKDQNFQNDQREMEPSEESVVPQDFYDSTTQMRSASF